MTETADFNSEVLCVTLFSTSEVEMEAESSFTLLSLEMSILEENPQNLKGDFFVITFSLFSET
jgi:hypothetical protein